MRTFLLLVVVATAVAVGMGFIVGLFAIDTQNSHDKYVVTFTINTEKMSHSLARQERQELTSSEDRADGELVDVKGKITAVRPEKNELVLSENIKSWKFSLAKDAQVLVNDRPSKLADLRAGDDATVTFERSGQELIASTVRCTRK